MKGHTAVVTAQAKARPYRWAAVGSDDDWAALGAELQQNARALSSAIGRFERRMRRTMEPKNLRDSVEKRLAEEFGRAPCEAEVKHAVESERGDIEAALRGELKDLDEGTGQSITRAQVAFLDLLRAWQTLKTELPKTGWYAKAHRKRSRGQRIRTEERALQVKAVQAFLAALEISPTASTAALAAVALGFEDPEPPGLNELPGYDFEEYSAKQRNENLRRREEALRAHWPNVTKRWGQWLR